MFVTGKSNPVMFTSVTPERFTVGAINPTPGVPVTVPNSKFRFAFVKFSTAQRPGLAPTIAFTPPLPVAEKAN